MKILKVVPAHEEVPSHAAVLLQTNDTVTLTTASSRKGYRVMSATEMEDHILLTLQDRTTGAYLMHPLDDVLISM